MLRTNPSAALKLSLGPASQNMDNAEDFSDEQLAGSITDKFNFDRNISLFGPQLTIGRSELS